MPRITGRTNRLLRVRVPPYSSELSKRKVNCDKMSYARDMSEEESEWGVCSFLFGCRKKRKMQIPEEEEEEEEEDTETETETETESYSSESESETETETESESECETEDEAEEDFTSTVDDIDPSFLKP